jgi:hypothetical protein
MAYFANGTEGLILDNQCAECPLGQKACPIMAVQLMHNYDQCGNPNLQEAMSKLVNEQGLCQLKPLLTSMQEEEDDDIIKFLERTHIPRARSFETVWGNVP